VGRADILRSVVRLLAHPAQHPYVPHSSRTRRTDTVHQIRLRYTAHRCCSRSTGCGTQHTARVRRVQPLWAELAQPISAKPVFLNDFERGNIQLYRNAKREGVLV